MCGCGLVMSASLGTPATFGLSVCFALWFALLIVASALYSDWVLLFNLMFLVFLPVPVIIGGLGKNSGGEAEVCVLPT